jgi:hypothetical protein
MALPSRKPSSVADRLKGKAICAPKVVGAARVATREVTPMAPQANQWESRKGETGLALLTYTHTRREVTAYLSEECMGW